VPLFVSVWILLRVYSDKVQWSIIYSQSAEHITAPIINTFVSDLCLVLHTYNFEMWCDHPLLSCTWIFRQWSPLYIEWSASSFFFLEYRLYPFFLEKSHHFWSGFVSEGSLVLVSEMRPLEESTASAYTTQILMGLPYLHHNVTHRWSDVIYSNFISLVIQKWFYIFFLNSWAAN